MTVKVKLTNLILQKKERGGSGLKLAIVAVVMIDS
jgi:hypothetical protein